MATWLDSDREDLRLIPLSESLGWVHKFAHKDIQANRTNPEEIPEHSVSFTKETPKGFIRAFKSSMAIGYGAPTIWISVEFIEDHMCDSINHQNLETLFNTINEWETLKKVSI